ncbi:hypothetical protein AAFF_G00319150 [Aldrovandia affinis]|uniref:Reverse transcriptase domain-containing protein n=1 Tax=Aldrovandia affinis TaxID=143900 RepID=A0AAD7SNT9_9TELE|nr:hypothetical protein AAFF_G00319150 [Aldrovandia affinis]
MASHPRSLISSIQELHAKTLFSLEGQRTLYYCYCFIVTQVPARISACLTDISAWMSTHHLKLNLGKTELLFLPVKSSPMIDYPGRLHSISVRSLGLTLADQLLRPHCSNHPDLPILPA